MAKMRPEDVRLDNVRIVWPNLFTPRASSTDKNADPKYSVAVLIPKDEKKLLEKIKTGYNAALEAGVKKFGEAFRGKGKTPLVREEGMDKGILIDCDTSLKPESLDSEDVAGCYLMNLNRKNKPGVVTVRDGALVHIEEDEISGGDYCSVTLSFYPYSHESGAKGISKSLNNICLLDRGEPLGTGSASAESDFADMADAASFGASAADDDDDFE